MRLAAETAAINFPLAKLEVGCRRRLVQVVEFDVTPRANPERTPQILDETHVGSPFGAENGAARRKQQWPPAHASFASGEAI
jgi:hypothetical protein